MTRIVVKKLIWDEYNIEHIKKHDIEAREAEEASKDIIVHKKGKRDRYLIIGRCDARIITLILRRVGLGIYYLVTARDAAKKERQKVYEKEKNQIS